MSKKNCNTKSSRRSNFGAFGSGFADGLGQMMGPFTQKSEFGKQRPHNNRRKHHKYGKTHKSRSRFGAFGSGFANSLTDVMGPYPSSSFGKHKNKKSSHSFGNKKRTSRFGAFGSGFANSLTDVMGPYPSLSFGRSKKY